MLFFRVSLAERDTLGSDVEATDLVITDVAKGDAIGRVRLARNSLLFREDVWGRLLLSLLCFFRWPDVVDDMDDVCFRNDGVIARDEVVEFVRDVLRLVDSGNSFFNLFRESEPER